MFILSYLIKAVHVILGLDMIVIPAIGLADGEQLDFGDLLGNAPVMNVNTCSPHIIINRGGRIPAPIQSLKN